MVGRKNKRTNNRTMFPTLKNNAAAGYKGPVKIELLEGTGLPSLRTYMNFIMLSLAKYLVNFYSVLISNKILL